MEKVKLSNFMPPAATATEVTINDTTFTIVSDIPYEDLLTHIQWSILLITDTNGYISEPVKIACRELILVAAFTNIDMSRLELATIEQPELYEMYDIVKKTGIVAKVMETIDAEQLNFYLTTLDATLTSILNYRNSVAGIVELLSSQSEELKEKFEGILEDFNDPAKTENVVKLAELMRGMEQTAK